MKSDDREYEWEGHGAPDGVSDTVPVLPLMKELRRVISDEIESTAISSRAANMSNMCSIVSPAVESPLPSPVLSDSTSASEGVEPSAFGEENSLTGQLDHFIPVGVLKYHDGESVSNKKLKCDSPAHYPESEIKSLESHDWIRTSLCKYGAYQGWRAIRIYVLPDDTGHKFIPRSSSSLRRALKLVMSKVDRSTEAWAGRVEPASDLSSESENGDESLNYTFNTLDPPNPDPAAVSDPWASVAMEGLLSRDDESHDHMVSVGLKTRLYSYQRRSAAFMLQRESDPGQSLDPRLQRFEGPTGQVYYFDRVEANIVREKRLYSNACGGILAETMGSGKTLICLALILATRGHFPRIPPDYVEGLLPVRRKTGTLADMAAATAGRFSLPWKRYFEQSEASECLRICERNRGSYTIYNAPRFSRGTLNSQVKATHVRLCSGTLVIVPQNLLDLWQNQIKEHTKGLEVCVVPDCATDTPPADKLLAYDIVLIARHRFDVESRRITNGFHTTKHISPLQELHWLRIIVDEGHDFASSGQKTNAAHLLDNLHVERRWIVSGTPSDGLYGTEGSLASQGTESGSFATYYDKTRDILKARKDPSRILDEELKNLDKLRRHIVDFLNLKPWSNSRAHDPANWSKYIKPTGTDGKDKMSLCLRSTLQSIVVRHPDDFVYQELPLPTLHTRVVALEPTYYDKLSLNLFIFHLVVNAITSERTDEDYMFHNKNRKYLGQLISNLRHAGFWWTGHKADKVMETLHVAQKYMENNKERMAKSDYDLLGNAIRAAELALSSHSWNAFSRFEEPGVFVQDFPEKARAFWSIDDLQEHQQPLLLSLSQAIRAQQFVTSHLHSVDPAEGIVGAGIRVKRELHEKLEKKDKFHKNLDDSRRITQSRSPASSKQQSKGSPRSQNQEPSAFISLPRDSPLANTKIVATSSAKLTYLLQKVLDFHEHEKIIIFYEHDPAGYWIAEGLEILGIRFRLYSSGLRPQQKSEYLDAFTNNENVRVLLMDLRQAAHGLHVACASRVFIVNPIWDSNVEIQAIKRAHRISQTRPVYVETLVLKDTLEDKMLRRRKEMTNAEYQHAKKDLLDDRTMNYTIQSEGFLPITENEISSSPAYLSADPPGFFDRHKRPVSGEERRRPECLSAMSDNETPFPARNSLPLSPSPSPHEPANLKRKISNDLPRLYSDVNPSPSPNNTPRKRPRASVAETVDQNGIVLLPSQNSTLRPRRGSTASSRHSSMDRQQILIAHDTLPAASEDMISLSDTPEPN